MEGLGMVKSAMGRHLDRNGILATPDCRGGVFAVFAKISPPTRFTIRTYMPSPVAASLTVKADADGVWGALCAMRRLRWRL